MRSGGAIKVPGKVDELRLTVDFFDEALGDYVEHDISVRFMAESVFFRPLVIINTDDWIKVVDLTNVSDIELAELVDDDMLISVSRSLKGDYTMVRAWFGSEE